MLDMYEIADIEIGAFRGRWCGPTDSAPHHDPLVIARYPKDPADGDGCPVEVLREAWPAVFYTIRVLPGTNSVGEPRGGHELAFGSGRGNAKLVAQIADQIARGMLVVRAMATA